MVSTFDTGVPVDILRNFLRGRFGGVESGASRGRRAAKIGGSVSETTGGGVARKAAALRLGQEAYNNPRRRSQ